MATKPKISVIVPNHNKGEFIGEAIESVMNQTFKDYELIVVDDASTDDSVRVIEIYEELDKLRAIKLERRLGVSAVRNIGIKNARGEIISLLDSDDVYSPVKLEKQIAVLEEESKPVIVYSEWWRIDEKGRILPPGKRDHPRGSGQIFGDILALGFGVNTTFMIPKHCLDVVGLYDESLPWGEDYDLVLRLAQKFDFRHLDDVLYGYRNYEGNTRNNLERKERLWYQSYVMEKHLKSGRELLNDQNRKRVISSLIRSYSLTGQRKKMLRYGLTSFGAFKNMLSSMMRERPIE
jgi:glycosyltransferase involved in cell wall biosynthesis